MKTHLIKLKIRFIVFIKGKRKQKTTPHTQCSMLITKKAYTLPLDYAMHTKFTDYGLLNSSFLVTMVKILNISESKIISIKMFIFCNN